MNCRTKSLEDMQRCKPMPAAEQGCVGAVIRLDFASDCRLSFLSTKSQPLRLSATNDFSECRSRFGAILDLFRF
ncbi:hypothetical protein PTI98_005571 [Pleurotus ostreatus]|nr:hypothetical protein PTI98_005571 [Pleurotus ostreatus]